MGYSARKREIIVGLVELAVGGESLSFGQENLLENPNLGDVGPGNLEIFGRPIQQAKLKLPLGGNRDERAVRQAEGQHFEFVAAAGLIERDLVEGCAIEESLFGGRVFSGERNSAFAGWREYEEMQHAKCKLQIVNCKPMGEERAPCGSPFRIFHFAICNLQFAISGHECVPFPGYGLSTTSSVPSGVATTRCCRNSTGPVANGCSTFTVAIRLPSAIDRRSMMPLR